MQFGILIYHFKLFSKKHFTNIFHESIRCCRQGGRDRDRDRERTRQREKERVPYYTIVNPDTLVQSASPTQPVLLLLSAQYRLVQRTSDLPLFPELNLQAGTVCLSGLVQGCSLELGQIILSWACSLSLSFSLGMQHSKYNMTSFFHFPWLQCS